MSTAYEAVLEPLQSNPRIATIRIELITPDLWSLYAALA